MVLDRYRGKTVRTYTNGKRKLESAWRNCNKINKSLENPGIGYMEANKNGRVSKGARKRYNRKDVDDDDDEDDVSMESACDDAMESSGEWTNDDAAAFLTEPETVQLRSRRKVMPKRKKLNERVDTKKKNPIANPQAKMKRSEFEFAVEPMDVSDDEEEMQEVYGKYRRKTCNLSKKQLAIIKAELKKRKKDHAVKIEKKPKKAKAKATPCRRTLKKKKKKKGRGKSEDENSMHTADCVKSGNATEQKGSKPGIQNEKKGGDNANYNTDTADKKGNPIGDTRNINNEKAVSDEKKTTAAVNKGPGHSDITAKASKDNGKNDGSKDGKPKEKVEDLSKKVDQKDVKDMDEGVAMTLPKPRLQKSRRPTVKMARMTSGKPAKRVSPFIKFYMTVYRELCDTRSIRTIAREAAKRWKGMTAEEKNKFYTKIT